jgi:hypothetical protein
LDVTPPWCVTVTNSLKEYNDYICRVMLSTNSAILELHYILQNIANYLPVDIMPQHLRRLRCPARQWIHPQLIKISAQCELLHDVTGAYTAPTNSDRKVQVINRKVSGIDCGFIMAQSQDLVEHRNTPPKPPQ